MKLLFGLGNPGSRYVGTRHNIGFAAVDNVAQRLDVGFRAGKGDFYWADGSFRGHRVLLIKPSTYMNNSGLAVREVVQFYKVDLSRILVVCDDAALPAGTLRLRPSGSDGGQNGLKSVILSLNSDRVARLRVGIANSTMGRMNLADFVLSRFDDSEESIMADAVDRAGQAVLRWIERGLEDAMNQTNRPPNDTTSPKPNEKPS